MEAYSQDLRERVVGAVEAGVPKTEAARRFSVSVATVTVWVRRQQTTGTVAPRPMHLGRKTRIGPNQTAALDAQLRAYHDATLDEHVALWAKDHGPISRATMARTIGRMGWTFKKKQWQPPSATSARVDASDVRSRGSIPHGSSRSMRPAPRLR